MPKHSKLSYLGVKRLNSGNIPVYGVSINSEAVLEAYHSKLIPKAIEYSAGVLDYFFRGRLETAWIGASAPEKSALRIVNKSGQDLKGGTFELFYDNASGTRTKIEPSNFTTTYADTLADNDMIEAEFTTPTGPITAYTLVYKGTLVKDGTSEDPVDKDIAIAANRITCIEGPGDPIDRLPQNLCEFAFDTLTIANFSEVKTKLAPCATCTGGSPLPEWDGTIPKDPGVNPCEDGGLQWLLATQSPYLPVRSLGGSSIKVVVFPVSWQWELEITCYDDQSQSWHVIWSGHKSRGYSPRGSYIVSPIGLSTDPGCDAAEASCITLQ